MCKHFSCQYILHTLCTDRLLTGQKDLTAPAISPGWEEEVDLCLSQEHEHKVLLDEIQIWFTKILFFEMVIAMSQ